MNSITWQITTQKRQNVCIGIIKSSPHFNKKHAVCILFSASLDLDFLFILSHTHIFRLKQNNRQNKDALITEYTCMIVYLRRLCVINFHTFSLENDVEYKEEGKKK